MTRCPVFRRSIGFASRRGCGSAPSCTPARAASSAAIRSSCSWRAFSCGVVAVPEPRFSWDAQPKSATPTTATATQIERDNVRHMADSRVKVRELFRRPPDCILPPMTPEWDRTAARNAGRGRPWPRAAILGLFFLLSGCDGLALLPGSSDRSVVASIMNVTPFEVDVRISGVVGQTAEIAAETVAARDSVDVAFTCLDELVIGNPLDPGVAGAVVHTDAGPVELEPFLLRAGEAFFCGEILEIIVSGDRPENLRMDVFVLARPR